MRTAIGVAFSATFMHRTALEVSVSATTVNGSVTYEAATLFRQS